MLCHDPDIFICSHYAKGESTLHLLSHIYAQRAFEVWKGPEIAEWIRSTVNTSLLQRLSTKPSERARAISLFERGTPENFVRHVIVAENRSVMGFLSPNAVPNTMVSFDPVPPRTSLSQYDQTYFGEVMERTARRRGAASGAHQHPEAGNEEQLIQVQEMIMQEIRRRQGPVEMPGGLGRPLHEGEVDSDLEDNQEEPDEEEDEEGDANEVRMLHLEHPK